MIVKKFVNRYYAPFINIYTVWILYLMFFAYYRGASGEEHYFIRAKPFESIHFLIYESGYIQMEKYKNIVGNIILFAPYGFLGILYTNLKSFFNLLIVFVIIINILEFSQYFFGRGFAELDDVILNTLGMSIGYLTYKKFFIIKD